MASMAAASTTSRRVTREELERMSKADAVRSALTVARGDSKRAAQWLVRNGLSITSRHVWEVRPLTRKNACRWLEEDGVVDLMAIDLVISGTRQVALTPTERSVAVRSILAAGGERVDVARLLGVDHTVATRLVDEATAMEPARCGAGRAA